MFARPPNISNIQLNPLTFAAVAILLALVALLVCCLPAASPCVSILVALRERITFRETMPTPRS